MPSLNCSGKCIDWEHSLTVSYEMNSGRQTVLDSGGRGPSVYGRNVADLWQSRAEAPDQREWTVLGKCAERQLSTFFPSVLLKVLHLDSLKFLSQGNNKNILPMVS